ncbi:MAG TPA: phosphoglucosamine mutase [Ilumatobacteraceae bacterium]|nr:phosphoglucosamine mutase [Ilumatobacteraceae bacterium]
MGQLRFGTDGVRGAAFDELTTDYVASLGHAAAVVLGTGEWLIGRDTRESGPALEQALIDGLRAGHAEPLRAGVLPTPALAYLSARHQTPAAMITASHNPYRDNGVKIFAVGGLKLTDDAQRAIEGALSEPQPAASNDPGRVLSTAIDEYCEFVVQACSPGSLDGLRIVLDCANGAMYEAAPRVVKALGAEVIVINAEPNGRNINDHCGATHPASLSAAVVDQRADLGLAFDGDGDRVIAVDEFGMIVDGDRMIALAALQLREDGQLTHDTVVVTVMSNLGFHKAMSTAGIKVVTTAVGDRSVLEALDAGDYAIGGEQSGHIIYPHLASTGDGLLAGLRLAGYVRSTGRPLADLAGNVMTSYPQVLVNVKVADRHPRVAAELAGEIAAAEASLDGEGRILVRPSGTEPLIRVMVEAATHDLAQATAESLAEVVLARFG